jgi:DNA-binding transcriptional LysR family regulator
VLRFVVDGAYPMAPVMRALKVFGDRQIPTRVHVDVEYQDGVIARFEGDNADIMLALGLEDGGRLQGVELPPLEMVLVVAADHPLATMRGLAPATLLEHVDLVVKDSAPAFARVGEQALLHPGVSASGSGGAGARRRRALGLLVGARGGRRDSGLGAHGQKVSEAPRRCQPLSSTRHRAPPRMPAPRRPPFLSARGGRRAPRPVWLGAERQVGRAGGAVR